MKKGRHRRYEEARAIKRSTEPSLNELSDRADEQPCPECAAEPGHDHASWCMFEENQQEAEAESDGWG